jgi:hypothetical protein
LFEDSLPATLGRDQRDVSLPISFIEDLNSTSTREAVLDVYATWARRLVDADHCSITMEDGAGQLVLLSLTKRGGLPKGTERSIASSIVGAV